jgi:hypothetical protein
MNMTPTGKSRMQSFLLRFQEPIMQLPDHRENPPSRTQSIASGTNTLTEVAREAADADPSITGYAIFPKNTSNTSTSYMLRFQEQCIADPREAIRCGTKTKTAVDAERPDNDPGVSHHNVFAEPTTAAGTATCTRIRAEHQDVDTDLPRLLPQEDSIAFPQDVILCGTRTITNVEAERSDNDPQVLNSSIFAQPITPRGAATDKMATATGTLTFVKAEASDKDSAPNLLLKPAQCFSS